MIEIPNFDVNSRRVYDTPDMYFTGDGVHYIMQGQVFAPAKRGDERLFVKNWKPERLKTVLGGDAYEHLTGHILKAIIQNPSSDIPVSPERIDDAIERFLRGIVKEEKSIAEEAAIHH